MYFYLGRLLAFLINIGQEWKGLPGTNTSLLRIFVKYGRKKFYNIGPREQCYKTLFVRNLGNFVISTSVCPFQPSLMFASKPGAYLSEASFRCSTL